LKKKAAPPVPQTGDNHFIPSQSSILTFRERERVVSGHMAEFHIDGSGLTLEKTHFTMHEPSNAQYPDVFVGKLRAEDRKALAEGKPVTGIKLGAGENAQFQFQLTQALVNDLQTELMKVAEDAFILLWDGNKIPRGAEVNGHRIGWTQNGQVLSDEGGMIGVYDRLMQYGGPSGKEQQMIVFVTVPPKTSQK